jgi:hypothetical protein
VHHDIVGRDIAVVGDADVEPRCCAGVDDARRERGRGHQHQRRATIGDRDGVVLDLTEAPIAGRTELRTRREAILDQIHAHARERGAALGITEERDAERLGDVEVAATMTGDDLLGRREGAVVILVEPGVDAGEDLDAVACASKGRGDQRGVVGGASYELCEDEPVIASVGVGRLAGAPLELVGHQRPEPYARASARVDCVARAVVREHDPKARRGVAEVEHAAVGHQVGAQRIDVARDGVAPARRRAAERVGALPARLDLAQVVATIAGHAAPVVASFGELDRAVGADRVNASTGEAEPASLAVGAVGDVALRLA